MFTFFYLDLCLAPQDAQEVMPVSQCVSHTKLATWLGWCDWWVMNDDTYEVEEEDGGERNGEDGENREA